MQLKGLLNFFPLAMFKFLGYFEKSSLGVLGILLLYFVSWIVSCLSLHSRSITVIILKCKNILPFFSLTVEEEKVRLIPVT